MRELQEAEALVEAALERLKKMPSSRSKSMAIQRLEEGLMWLERVEQ